MDRFIPFSNSSRNYRSLQSESKNVGLLSRRSSPNLHSVEFHIMPAEESISQRLVSTSLAISTEHLTKNIINKKNNDYPGIIGQALGFNRNQRVLNFKNQKHLTPKKYNKKSKSNHKTAPSSSPSLVNYNSTTESSLSNGSHSSQNHVCFSATCNHDNKLLDTVGPLMSNIAPHSILQYLANDQDIYEYLSNFPSFNLIPNSGIGTYSSSQNIVRFHHGSNSPSPRAMITGLSHSIPNRQKKIKTQIPFKVLDAPGLRNDFYSNLISWCPGNNKVAVALSTTTYIWSEDLGAVALPHTQEIITSILFSPVGELLLVGTKNGKLKLYKNDSLLTEFNLLNSDFHLLCNNQTNSMGIYSVCWLPGSCSDFFVGTEIGYVCFFKVVLTNSNMNNSNNPTNNESTSEYSLELIISFKTNNQQVCGLAIPGNKCQIACGGNDNTCTIWDITDILHPELKYELPHKAAVKAIAYCPWSNSLLATGAGSKDRTIRFWHTNSGTLSDSMNTKGQITSSVWSRSKKQILATFGFSDIKSPLLLTVYTYPTLQPVLQVPATSNLRVSTSALSPDFKSICIATNDETIRFYEIWSTRAGLVTSMSHESGVFGSDLIDLSEGINKIGEQIR